MPLNNTKIFTSDWKLRDQNLNPFTYCHSKRRKRSRRKLAGFIVEVKKSKNSETLSRDDVIWNPRGEKKGWKRTQRRVSWLKRSRTIRLIGLARWKCEGAAGVKATKASPRRGKWVHYNQQESRDGVCGGLNEQRPDLMAVRGTVGWAKVNKPTSNTTRRGAARKRPSVIVCGSGMMWLSTQCVIVFNVGRFSAPEPDDDTHLLMNPRSQFWYQCDVHVYICDARIDPLPILTLVLIPVIFRSVSPALLTRRKQSSPWVDDVQSIISWINSRVTV